jgi:hypothetical protein
VADLDRDMNSLTNVNGIQSRKSSHAINGINGGSDSKNYRRVVSIYQQQAQLQGKPDKGVGSERKNLGSSPYDHQRG